LTLKICSSVEKYSPDRRWHVDTIIKVLTLAGNYVQDESLYSLLHLISATPQLQTYAAHKIFFSLRENISQEGLAKAGLWCIGEFGNLLISGKATASDNTPIHVSEDEVLTLI
jgi:AP-1 complex subunit gamma-1